MILCRTLGPVEISVDGSPAPAELLWRKNLALLIYLAHSPGQTRGRDHLIGLLWSDKPESSARHSLNEALRSLRRVLGDSGLTTTAQQVRIEPGAVALDTTQLQERIRARDWAAAESLVTGEFMESFALPDAAEFQQWLDAERQVWTRKSTEALNARAGELLTAGAVSEAMETADRGLRIDRFAEPLLRVLLRALALGNNRPAALERFERFARLMQDELAAEPEPDTLELVDRIRKGADKPVPLASSSAVSPPLVGRGSQMRQILETWENCRTQKEASLVLIHGEAGVGKTHLLDEIRPRLELDGAAVMAVRAVAADREHPGSVLLGLARGGLLGLTGISGAPPSALVTFAAADPGWREAYGHLSAETMPIIQALIEILETGMDEQPAALVVDDAQWSDRDSLLALDKALRDLARCPLLVLIAAGAEPHREELDAVQVETAKDIPGVIVRLEPFTSADLRALARWWFPNYRETDLERICRRIGTDSAGIPLLAAELFRAVADGLDLSERGHTWPSPHRTLDHSLPTDLPDAVVAAIRVRYRRLSQTAQQLLASASVLEGRFDARLAGCLLDRRPEELTEALDELEWTRWLVSDARGYTFAARIMKEVVNQDMLTPGQRRRIEDRVVTCS
jgi:DNA-binding SARP family transcriptional activator